MLIKFVIQITGRELYVDEQLNIIASAYRVPVFL